MSTHKPTAEEAANLLKDVAEDWQAFWCNHGAIAKNMGELSSCLASMTPEQFAHHVNAEKNDFAAWTEQVVGDASLATKMRLLTTLEATQRMVARRVEELSAAMAPSAEAATLPAAPAVKAEPAPQPAAKKPAAVKKSSKKPGAKHSPRTVAAKSAQKPVVAAAKPGDSQKESVWTKLLKR